MRKRDRNIHRQNSYHRRNKPLHDLIHRSVLFYIVCVCKYRSWFFGAGIRWLHTNIRLMSKRDKWLLTTCMHKCRHSHPFTIYWLCGQSKVTNNLKQNKIGSICAHNNNKRCTQRTWLTMYLCRWRWTKTKELDKEMQQQFVVLEFKMISNGYDSQQNWMLHFDAIIIFIQSGNGTV